MDIQKYNVNQHLIETLLAWVKGGEIAIPEIQRPFVWDSSKVRDLMDSLYQGFPIGYVITSIKDVTPIPHNVKYIVNKGFVALKASSQFCVK